MPDDPTNNVKDDVSYTDGGRPVGLVIAGIISVLAVIFVLQNLGETETQFLFLSATIPLAAVILISMAFGAVVGWFVAFVMRRRKRSAD